MSSNRSPRARGKRSMRRPSNETSQHRYRNARAAALRLALQHLSSQIVLVSRSLTGPGRCLFPIHGRIETGHLDILITPPGALFTSAFRTGRGQDESCRRTAKNRRAASTIAVLASSRPFNGGGSGSSGGRTKPRGPPAVAPARGSRRRSSSASGRPAESCGRRRPHERRRPIRRRSRSRPEA